MISPVELNANVVISSKCSFFRKNLDENFCTVYRRIWWRVNLLYGKLFAENCMKMKEFGRGASLAPSFDAPLMMPGIFWRLRTNISGFVSAKEER